MDTRRKVLKMTAAQTALVASASLTGAHLTTALAAKPLTDRRWLTALGTNLADGHDYWPYVEGTIPPALQGTLFRNGPGRFERDGFQKNNVLNGDGMIRALSIGPEGVRFRNKFVETPKYLEEEAAGRFNHATWTTRRPGGVLANVGGGGIETQAGVTIYNVGRKLLAIDELGLPFELDPHTLATKGTYQVGEPGKASDFKAHTKFDAATGEWLLCGTEYGPSMRLHIIVHAPGGALKSHVVVPTPRQVYVHDFFATENYILFNLHPVDVSLFSFLAGLKSLTDGIRLETGRAQFGDGGSPGRYRRAGGPRSSRRFHVACAQCL